MPYADVYVESEKASVNITRFEPGPGETVGRIGISPDEGVVNGYDVFSEQAFVDAIWELYPDGLPPKALSKKEKRIREVATYLLNGPLIERTYEQAVQDLDPATVEAAREDAKALIALVLDGDE